MTTDTLFAQIAHDIRGSVGSLRLVLGAVIDEDDPTSRAALIHAADDEARRLAAGLAALPALETALTDRTEPVALDLGDALRTAATVVSNYQASVDLHLSDPVVVRSRPAVLARTLPALLLLPCALSGATEVRVVVLGDRASITCSGTTLWTEGRRLAVALAGANDWTVEDGPAAMHIEAPIL